MKQKMRLVSVRLSQDEYDRLKALSSQRSRGNVSGLIRASMHGILMNGNRTLIDLLSEFAFGHSTPDLAQPSSPIQLLERRLDILDREIKQLTENNQSS